MDFIVPQGQDALLIEAKATRTPRPEMGAPITKLTRAMLGGKVAARGFVVHRGPAGGTTALSPGLRAVALSELLAALR